MLKMSTSWVHMAAEPSYFDNIVKIIIGKRYMNLMMAHDRGSEFGFCVTQFNLLVDIFSWNKYACAGPVYFPFRCVIHYY